MTKPQRLLHLRHLGVCDYASTWQAMQAFTATRDIDTVDELWMLEHPPVFTLGQAGNVAHVRQPGDIPIIRTDRGGQVTYHAPGQLVCYLLFDLRRAGVGVRQLVQLLEQAVILLLAELSITAERREQAPGVYVNGAKIAALGLRVRRGCSYHGLALNLNMDLMPFTRINPCGYSDLQVTQLTNCGVIYQRSAIEQRLSELFAELLGLQLLNCD